MTIEQAVLRATEYLAARGLKSPRQDADLLLTSILGRDRAFVLAHPQWELSPSQEEKFLDWLARRGEHYPLQYLRGVQEFWGREFAVSPAVLIPRPETEAVVETCLDLIRRIPGAPVRVLDIGTGCGCIAVTLACEDSRTRVTATDISGEALQVARKNAERHACLDRLEFLVGDAISPVRDRTGHYHLVASNPPYVQKDSAEVDPAVARYEPREAVFAGQTGLEVYRRILRDGTRILGRNGRLVVELGYGVLRSVMVLATEYGWVLEQTRKDLAGIDRCAAFRVEGK